MFTNVGFSLTFLIHIYQAPDSFTEEEYNKYLDETTPEQKQVCGSGHCGHTGTWKVCEMFCSNDYSCLIILAMMCVMIDSMRSGRRNMLSKRFTIGAAKRRLQKSKR